MNSGPTFSTISSRAIVRMQKDTLFLFTEEEIFWRRSGCWGCRSGYFRFMLDQQHEPRARQMLQMFQKLQCLNDTSILTKICKRLVYPLTRNRSNGNLFLAYNRPFQLLTFQATASRVCERDPSAHEKEGAPEGQLEIVTIFGIQNKHLIFCALYSPYSCYYIRIVISGVVLQSKTFPVPYVDHAVVTSESHLTSFPRARV